MLRAQDPKQNQPPTRKGYVIEDFAVSTPSPLREASRLLNRPLASLLAPSSAPPALSLVPSSERRDGPPDQIVAEGTERSTGRERAGLGVAARAGGLLADRPAGRVERDLAGTKSATRIGTMINIKREKEDGNLENKMQNEALTRQSTCWIKSSLIGASTRKDPKNKIVVDATKVSVPGANANNTGHHQLSYRESKGSRKHGRFEDNEGATRSSCLQTQTNMFEDECVFCHSFRTSQFHGPMLQLQYLDGRLVSCKKGSPTKSNTSSQKKTKTKTMFVHKKCMEWAPRVFYEGDTIKNMEKEISRASKLRCSRCRLLGAALGCYSEHCTKSFHVPCAVMISDCRWDVDNGYVLCPEHASEVIPCDKMSSPKKKSESSFGVPQNHSNQNSVKKGIYNDCQTEDEQIDQLTTTNSSLPRQCSEKEVFANYQREEKQIDQITLRSCPTNQWVLLGSALSAQEKDALKNFASLTNATVAEQWDRNVTHVIVGRDAGFACSRSFEVLMAILSGKWVVTAGWIVDCLGDLIPGPGICLEELIPCPETLYEVQFFRGSHTSIDGPKKGRTIALEATPKLFYGLYFCLSTYMNPEEREHIQNLIAAAEGQILEGSSLHLLCKNLDKNSAKLFFIYDVGPPKNFTPNFPLDLHKELDEAVVYAASGAQVISHLRVFDAIATYDVQTLNRRDDHVALNFCA